MFNILQGLKLNQSSSTVELVAPSWCRMPNQVCNNSKLVKFKSNSKISSRIPFEEIRELLPSINSPELSTFAANQQAQSATSNFVARNIIKTFFLHKLQLLEPIFHRNDGKQKVICKANVAKQIEFYFSIACDDKVLK